MKSAIKLYGFINANLRARISDILHPPLSENLIKAGSLEEALQLLKDTPFSSLAEIFDNSGDMQFVELELFKMQIKNYRNIRKHVSDKPLLAFIDALTLKPEIENLKNVLRLWFGSRIKNRPISYRSGYIYQSTILNKLDWSRLLNAPSLGEICRALEAPYRAVLEEFKDQSPEETGIFRIETALDRMYYRLLLEKSGDLSLRDAQVVKELLAVEAELQNINWIIRYSYYYNVDARDLLEILIPLGRGFSLKALEEFLNRDSKQRDLSILVRNRFPRLAALSLNDREGRSSETVQALLFEELFEQTQEAEYHRLLTSHPFSIGIILVYFFLKARESRFIMAVLNGKYYGLPPEKISGLSWGQPLELSRS
ncbi:MAG: V-type ATPase subunit [Spirochaetales bacterium]|jgi:V/A-type H+-transporting ATPase subunit C|nr:V-type ATPase subunit [Spirochaetales bacterium]